MRIKLAFPLSMCEIANATQGRCQKSCENKNIYFITTDSREVFRGDLFIALKGENYNGEHFISDILKKGAFHFSTTNTENGIAVDDTRLGLLKLANHYKSKFKKLLYTIGITGSVGKTTTKEFTKAILSKKYTVHSTYKNNNNTLGVPLTVLSMPKGAEALVIEMGMNMSGEIMQSSDCVSPNISIILNVGTSHIGNLGSREKIAEAKLEILHGMKNGTLLVPYGEPLLERDEALTFALENDEADYYLEGGDLVSLYYRKKLYTKAPFKFGDRHLSECLCAASAIGHLSGLSSVELQKGISAIQEEHIRQKIIHVDDFFFLADCYNSSPESVKAALDSLTALPSYQRKSVLLGDILELGDRSEIIHQELGRLLAKYNFYNLYLFGKYSKNILEGLKEEDFPQSRVYINEDSSRYDITAKQIRENHTRGEIILVKASRGMQLERIFYEFETKDSYIKAYGG